MDDNIIYMEIPKEYESIYLKLLVYIIDFGIDLVKDCSAGCNVKNKKVIDCWNMFQSAVAAYSLAEVKDITDPYYKKSKFIINYINEQIDLTYSSEVIVDNIQQDNTDDIQAPIS